MIIMDEWTWQAFGRELILSEDLDPVYVMLANANIDDNILKRILLAYFCYYSCGVAARIAESKDFYAAMWQGIEERWPRGMERRYFWGKQAENTIAGLQAWGEPEAIVDYMTIHKTFQDASDAVQEFTGFGPWLGWKIVDCAERILAIPVDFSESTLGIYKDPVQGAAFVRFGDWRHPITEDELDEEVERQVVEFRDLLAPPFYDRPINIQEVETNLCKFKAHYKHAYPMGNDTFHVREGLIGWGDLAQELLRWCPKVKPGHKGYNEKEVQTT
jgi:hypothetical protein